MSNVSNNTTFIKCPNQDDIVFEVSSDGKKLIKCLYKCNTSNSQNKDLHTVFIPEGIEVISENAFSFCDYIDRITLPESIHYIENHAFLNCTNLDTVAFGPNKPRNTLYIKDDAFEGCVNLESSIMTYFSKASLFSMYAGSPRLETIYTQREDNQFDVTEIRKDHYNSMLQMAAYYNSIGMNLTVIKGKGSYDIESFKSPSDIPGLSLSESYQNKQDFSLLLKQDWMSATGLGLAVGYNNIRVIDVDYVHGCNYKATFRRTDNDHLYEISGYIEEILEYLGLPNNYPWVIQSGSHHGFHILIEVDDIGEEFKSIAFSPNDDHCFVKQDDTYPDTPFYERMEIHWKNHLVLPPSVSARGNDYRFRFGLLPSVLPSKVSLSKVNNMINNICGRIIIKTYTYNNVDFELVETIKTFSECGSAGYYVESPARICDSIHWLEACEDSNACNSLGIRYVLGRGVKQDKNKAYDLFAKSNSPLANFNMASLISCGYFEGTDLDVEKCLKNITNTDLKVDDDTLKFMEDLIRKRAKSHIKTTELYLFFDTETTGLPINYNASSSDTNNWPRLVQLAWILTDQNGNRINSGNHIIIPDGFVIPSTASNVHGITTQKAQKEGVLLKTVMESFLKDFDKASCVVGHNISFDKKIIGAELIRLGKEDIMDTKTSYCTMQSSVDFCKIPSFNGLGYKYPKLQELYKKLFGVDFDDAHNAMSDIEATEKCFWELRKRKLL